MKCSINSVQVLIDNRKVNSKNFAMLNYSYSIKTIALSISLITLVSTSKVTAQVITEITVDPYNDSGFQTSPLNINMPPNAEDINNTVYIDAPTTPTPTTEIKGELTSSNKFLPAIPPISEPYSQKQDNNNISIDPTNSSISVSPFDITPSDHNNVTEPAPNQARKINTTSVSSPNPSKKPSNNLYQKKLPAQPNQTRRTLRDILVQSNSSNQTNAVSVKSNNASTLSSENQKVYKVLVQANTMAEKQQIKSLYPEAFTKKIQGSSFLQIGIFSSQESVKQVSQSLANIGFKAVIME